MDRLFLCVLCVLNLSIGMLSGLSIASWQTVDARPMQIVSSYTGTIIPAVRIDGLRNNALHGSVVGSVRLFADGKPIAVTASGTFSITDRTVLTNTIELVAPAGMQYVASSKGTKYYPLSASAAGRIALQNRIYFKTALEAEQAGYKP